MSGTSRPSGHWVSRPAWVTRATASRYSRALTGVVCLVLVGVALIILGAVTSGGAAPRPPRPAKDFSLAVLGHPSQRLSLHSFAGRPVILNFFASWCRPCQRETPMIAAYYRAHHGSPPVLGIDAGDHDAAAQAFTARAGVSYPVVTDPLPDRTALSYGLITLPGTFFLNAHHEIVKTVLGMLSPAALTAGAKLIAPAHG